VSLLYWISTSLLSLIVLLSAGAYFLHEGTIDGIRELGFPDFFRVQLGVLKILAVVLLLLPMTPLQVREWAYAGLGLFFLTSIVAHVAHRDSFGLTLLNLVFIALLAASNFSFYKMKDVLPS
jgi:hypothetical protein